MTDEEKKTKPSIKMAAYVNIDSAANPNMAVWSAVEMTDPKYAKEFTRPGGFTGTAVDSTYLARKATALFGPMGIGWGVNVVNEEYREAQIIDPETGQRQVNHVLQVEFWYIKDGERGTIYHFGQTPFVYYNNKKKVVFSDEEAPKKSMTDATSKCLSMLGFSADIYMGAVEKRGIS